MNLLPARNLGARSLQRVGELWKALRDELRRRRVYRSNLRQLRRLSQRELDDMGIARNMISRLAAEAAWGKKS